MQHRCEQQYLEADSPSSFPLALASEGERVKITQLRGGCQLRERLLSMGICLEDEIQVIHRQHGGAILIEKTGGRFALGGGMAHKINVTRC